MLIPATIVLVSALAIAIGVIFWRSKHRNHPEVLANLSTLDMEQLYGLWELALSNGKERKIVFNELVSRVEKVMDAYQAFLKETFGISQKVLEEVDAQYKSQTYNIGTMNFEEKYTLYLFAKGNPALQKVLGIELALWDEEFEDKMRTHNAYDFSELDRAYLVMLTLAQKHGIIINL